MEKTEKRAGGLDDHGGDARVLGAVAWAEHARDAAAVKEEARDNGDSDENIDSQ